MKLRDRNETPWVIRATETFEAAFYRNLAAPEQEAGLEVVDHFELEARRNPRAAGSQHPNLPDLWIFETPSAIRRLPRIVIVYTIDDVGGFVDMWNLLRL